MNDKQQDWSLLEETQAALRDSWAIIKKLKAVQDDRLQYYVGLAARRNIELKLIEQLLEDSQGELTSSDMEYWNPLHDQLHEKLNNTYQRQQIADGIKSAVDAEREACARVCEEKGMVKGGEVFAAKIRARGKE